MVIESEVHAAPSVVFPVTLYQRLLGANRIGGTGYAYDEENKKEKVLDTSPVTEICWKPLSSR